MTMQAITGNLYRHIKRGTIYRVVTFGIIEATAAPAVVYQAQDNYGAIWIRPTSEFCDGRFEPVTEGGIEPHQFIPDHPELASCRTCCHVAESPVHIRPVSGVGDNHKLDTDTQVFFYEQDFYVLSNFSAFRLFWKGFDFDTSEAVYHWEKFSDPTIRRRIFDASSAHDAFKIAEAYSHLRHPNWDDVKVGIMRDILREKAAQHEYVRRKLLATGDRELIEDSWRDDFWGWGPNRDGQNMLGKLWMEVRAELRARMIDEKEVMSWRT